MAVIFVIKPVENYCINSTHWKKINSNSEWNVEQKLEQTENIVATYSDAQFHEVLAEGYDVYVPSSLITDDYCGSYNNLYTYFELENYPFFKKLKDVIKKDENKKGVFRFRRKVSEKEQKTISSDLYVLNFVFGDIENVEFAHSDRGYEPFHVILLVHYINGTFAHLEYTFTDEDSIEFDWSGLKRIIEFDGNEMNPVKTNDQSSSLMLYTDTILSTACQVNEELMTKLNSFKRLVDEGGL
ncbi:hypothetical protein [Virgibacillus halodenitrificans]|uniref:hypothetical protein n=1 Tax=Virgibacillus halodenitrificans TaxID=1482 RepID=UPI000761246E